MIEVTLLVANDAFRYYENGGWSLDCFDTENIHVKLFPVTANEPSLRRVGSQRRKFRTARISLDTYIGECPLESGLGLGIDLSSID